MTRQPGDLTPRRAVHRWLDGRRSEMRDETRASYWYRLKLWAEWCESNGIETVGELDGWLVDSYYRDRSGDGIAPITLQSEMKTLKLFIEYLERIEAVEDGLAEKVPIPSVEQSDTTDDTKLATADAVALLRYYRDDPASRGTRGHALLELFWHSGARVGGIRALDVRDFYPEADLVDFRHRPKSGTPLKNGVDGQRPVGIPRTVTEVLETYLHDYRDDVHDDHGRAPLFTTGRGRPSVNTFRRVCYGVTFPCNCRECPHDRDPESCEFTEHNQESKCPSSRSPHQVRTGSITYQRDLGFPPEVVAERVNSSVPVIEQYYDKATARERLERRRRRFVQAMDIEDNA